MCDVIVGVCWIIEAPVSVVPPQALCGLEEQVCSNTTCHTHHMDDFRLVILMQSSYGGWKMNNPKLCLSAAVEASNLSALMHYSIHARKVYHYMLACMVTC